ncbi:hypothetical protein PPACK8108_LOCUS8874 [Phakopsora pachyrhizi]|uniref:Uncharacterized protein n=1 Tax=Phakopsora pachyrhizi TaxID=170000 RepID=A0AAV0AW24_PHAPC|nr:hypothetical protein PPACK8108_LOCUS8874 [Phakopsora pachyrhizi]
MPKDLVVDDAVLMMTQPQKQQITLGELIIGLQVEMIYRERDLGIVHGRGLRCGVWDERYDIKLVLLETDLIDLTHWAETWVGIGMIINCRDTTLEFGVDASSSQGVKPCASSADGRFDATSYSLKREAEVVPATVSRVVVVTSMNKKRKRKKFCDIVVYSVDCLDAFFEEYDGLKKANELMKNNLKLSRDSKKTFSNGKIAIKESSKAPSRHDMIHTTNNIPLTSSLKVILHVLYIPKLAKNSFRLYPDHVRITLPSLDKPEQ